MLELDNIPKFKRKIVKLGNSHGFTIPSDYISNGLIDPKEEYEVSLTKIKKSIETPQNANDKAEDYY